MHRYRENAVMMMWLSYGGLSISTKLKLLEYFGDIQSVYEIGRERLSEVLDDSQIEKFNPYRELKLYEEKYDFHIKKGVRIIYYGSEDYPEKLLHISEPPLVLYARGRIDKSLNEFRNNIAIVGARKCSAYGLEMGRKFGAELAKYGFNIISGMALGIDACSHWGCLSSDGYTVGVLGCEIDRIYPRTNYKLFAEVEEKGLIISEYGIDDTPGRESFPRRNRIISALSDGVLVIEAKKKSGSLITANWALEQGKQIYAIPGRVLDVNSEGCNNLIRQGAMFTIDPLDIICDMKGIDITEVIDKDGKYVLKDKKHALNHRGIISQEINANQKLLANDEKKVYSCLDFEPKYIDDIIDSAKIGITNTISVLYSLEQKGLIKQSVRGYYSLSMK